MRRIASLSLLSLLFLPTASKAEFVFDPNLITVGVGPAFLSDGAGTTFFLHGRLDMASFTEDWIWDAGFHWWKKSYDESFGTVTAEFSVRDFALTTGAKYLFHVSNETWVPYARAGLGMNFVNFSAEGTGFFGGDYDVSQTDLGIYIGGGAHYIYSSSMWFGAEATANITDADHFLLGATVAFPFGSAKAAN